jgi:hypothetical protein
MAPFSGRFSRSKYALPNTPFTTFCVQVTNGAWQPSLRHKNMQGLERAARAGLHFDRQNLCVVREQIVHFRFCAHLFTHPVVELRLLAARGK